MMYVRRKNLHIFVNIHMNMQHFSTNGAQIKCALLQFTRNGVAVAHNYCMPVSGRACVLSHEEEQHELSRKDAEEHGERINR
jgi:hypothetical protein